MNPPSDQSITCLGPVLLPVLITHMSDTVCVTPFFGGREDGGVCALLESGGCRVLLDCGCTLGTTNAQILTVAKALAAGGGVDCVLLSHADIHHMGALPILFGKGGLDPVPVICTLPVHKFGQMLLYDLSLNLEMEGSSNAIAVATDEVAVGVAGKTNLSFTLDDIDRCLSKVVTVRYSQSINFPEGASDGVSQQLKQQLHFCALGSGRTIGGSVWRIRHGATEILYMMDINLKKEIVSDGMALDLLPTAPALVILEGGCASRTSAPSTAAQREKRAKGEDTTGVVQHVMDTLRVRGSALIPCDSGARLLELLQILGKHWTDARHVADHLVFLSPMSHNILEFARSQIEWMTDALSRQFIQMGKLNPFELPPLKVAHSLRDLERLYPGPKVVLATDPSLSCGMSKELLLRWGGNPLCRVILTDSSDSGSLASELRRQMASPPIVATVLRPQRVELVGAELASFQLEQDRKRREREEILQRRKREEALALLTAGRRDDEDDDDAAAGETSGESSSGSSSEPSSAESEAKRQKTSAAKKSSIARFATPSFPMFQNRDTAMPIDEYGMSVADLRFLRQVDEGASATALPAARISRIKEAAGLAPGTLAQKAAGLKGAQTQALMEEAELQEVPSKLVATKIRVQFTCDFKSVEADGRANLKAIRTALQRMVPARVLVLRGSGEDCDSVMACAKSCIAGVDTYAPASGTTVSFSVRADRVSLYLPSAVLPRAIRQVRRQGHEMLPGAVQESACTVCALSGLVSETSETVREGTRTLRLQASAENDAQADSGGSMVIMDGSNPLGAEGNAEGNAEAEEGGETGAFGTLSSAPLDLPQPAIGLVSVGEVSLNVLKGALEKVGLKVEALTAVSAGSVRAYLVCEGQVIVRKDNENDFVVEGPPVPAFFKARKCIYAHFAFV